MKKIKAKAGAMARVVLFEARKAAVAGVGAGLAVFAGGFVATGGDPVQLKALAIAASAAAVALGLATFRASNLGDKLVAAIDEG